MKPPVIFALLSFISLRTASAVTVLEPVTAGSSIGTISFNDTAAGGFITSVGFPTAPLATLLPYPWATYNSFGSSHIDRAAISITALDTLGVPWVGATGGLSQALNVSGDTAIFNTFYSAEFGGGIGNVDLSTALSSMAYTVGGNVSSHGGDFVTFQAHVDIIDVASGSIFHQLDWNFTRSIPGLFSGITVTPTLTSSGGTYGSFIGSNYIREVGFIKVSADPSSIDFTAAEPVPEPATMGIVLAGLVSLAASRKRRD